MKFRALTCFARMSSHLHHDSMKYVVALMWVWRKGNLHLAAKYR